MLLRRGSGRRRGVERLQGEIAQPETLHIVVLLLVLVEVPFLVADQVWPELERALLSPLLPLLAYAALGYCAGVVVRHSTAALATALGLVLVLDLGRAPAKALKFQEWLPSTYLPSPLGDRSSFIQYYTDVTQGISNAYFPHAKTELLTPSLWACAALLLAAAVFSRRSVS